MTELALPQREGRTLAMSGRLSSDERLAQLASRGDSRAFGQLYERHHRTLYGYCRSIVRNDEDAKDALQSAVMRALAALQASERDVAVRPWLFRIVHNEAVSLLRRRRPGDRPIDEQELALGSVEGTVEDRERLATLVGDIQSLGERQRGALLMRELSGLSIEEIAAALSTSPGAAKQALFEARCALHELAEGRAMECADVRQTISERDGRVLRGRKLRAHLRACAGCVQFNALIETRSADLRMLVPPLPAAGALGLLAHALDVGAGHASEAAVVSGTTVGGSATISLVAKGLAGAAIMTATTAGTAELVRHQARTNPPRHVSGIVAPARPAPVLSLRIERAAAPSLARPLAAPHPRRSGRHATGAVRDARPVTPRETPSPYPSTATAQAVAATPASQPTVPPAPDAGTSAGKSGSAPGRTDSTPPGLEKSGGVPPGLAKQGKNPKAQGNPHADPQGQPPTALAPATPGQPDSPGHSQDPHGHAPQGSSDAGHPGPPASHGPH